MTDQVDQDVVIDEEIEEAHDPKNDEAQSNESVDAAEKKGTKAPTRKGDKRNSQTSESTDITKVLIFFRLDILSSSKLKFCQPFIIELYDSGVNLSTNFSP